MNMKFTRQDYMNGLCSHDDYYSQFVNENIKLLVLERFNIEILQSAYAVDHHFNSLPLPIWDKLTLLFSCNNEMKILGDYSTLAGKVCILKQAAKMLILERNK